MLTVLFVSCHQKVRNWLWHTPCCDQKQSNKDGMLLSKRDTKKGGFVLIRYAYSQ